MDIVDLGIGLGFTAIAVGIGAAALTQKSKVGALSALKDYRPSWARGSDLSKPQPYTFEQWVQLAGYTQAAKNLTGHGYETLEIEWQMGEDPLEVNTRLVQSAAQHREFLERPERERRTAFDVELKANTDRAERERLAADINRKLMPGLAPPTREAQLEMLLAELEALGREK